MRDIHRVLVLGALAAWAISCGFIAAGCGGDTGQGTGDGEAIDGAADGTTGTIDSGPQGPDAGRDVRQDTVSDAQADNAKPDNATPDAQADTSTSDAQADNAVSDARADNTVSDAQVDNTVPDAQVDSTVPDAPVDNTVPDAPADNTVSDAQTDNTVSDAGLDSVAADALTDTAADVGVDVGQDTGMDSGLDAGDAQADAPADVGPDRTAEFAFAGQVATALCNQIALCCFPDGGTSAFNMPLCVGQNTGSGYQNSSYGVYAITNGNVNFDPDAGAACLGAIGSIASCTVTAALQPALITNCFSAYLGTLEAGASCAASMECAAGQVCAVTDGGATGVCSALRAVGQPCGDKSAAGPAIASEFCSYRGSGNTGLLCNQMDDAGNSLAPGSWTCQPQYPAGVGAFCNFDTDCVPPQICDLVTGTCVSTSRPLVYTGAGGVVCPAFTLDAGGGG